MREFAKKVGSLALAAGALTSVLVNAALQHGCASSQPAAGAQAEPGRDDMKPPDEVVGTERPKPVALPSKAPSLADVNAGSLGAQDDDGCDTSYMYATKAPVFRLGECHPAGLAAKRAASPSNARQQAP